MTEGRVRIDVPHERIADFCRRHHIRRLAFFGSVLRDDFRPHSDVDVLVEFEPGKTLPASPSSACRTSCPRSSDGAST